MQLLARLEVLLLVLRRGPGPGLGRNDHSQVISKGSCICPEEFVVDEDLHLFEGEEVLATHTGVGDVSYRGGDEGAPDEHPSEGLQPTLSGTHKVPLRAEEALDVGALLGLTGIAESLHCHHNKLEKYQKEGKNERKMKRK